MASHQAFAPLEQEPKFKVQRQKLRSRADDGTNDRKKEDVIALPPVRGCNGEDIGALATTSQENQIDRLQTPLNKWQIHRCATPNTTPCQEELVNEWLHRNHIQVVDRLPKMDPVVLTSRGTDVSKYISFIHPPPFSLKLLSGTTEEQKYRDKRNKLTQAPLPTFSSPCPRLLRCQRSDREMFAVNPVIRVGGGYRRLSWKVLDVLPSIGQYDPDVDSAYSCASCHANLQVVEKVTNSRGRVRSILTTPKQCHKCGAPTTNSQILAEKDLHESVVDTLHRGDSRFIVDHRRFKKSNVVHPSSGNNPADLHSNSPMDWRDDLESFRLHMSRQSQTEDDLDTIVYGYKRNRSESGSSSVFMTEPGANIDDLNEPPDVRRAWDDGITRAKIFRDNEDDVEEWEKGNENGEKDGKENRSSATDNDLDAYSDFEVIEDYDPKSGFTVRFRRKPFGGAEKTSYFIRGIRDEEGSNQRSLDKSGKKKTHHKQGFPTDTQHNKRAIVKRNKQTLARKKRGNVVSSESGKRQQNETNQKTKHEENSLLRKNSFSEKQREDETNQRTKHHKKLLSRTDSFYVVGLDQRDKVFSATPVLEESSNDEDDDNDVIVFTETRFSENSLSDFEFKEDDSWSPDSPGSGLFRPKMPSPGNFGNQDKMDRPSSWSVTPTQHDGYLADSEENADLTLLQAQIQQARNNAKTIERRKNESQETMRRESIEKNAKDERIAATEDSTSQRPLENDSFDRTLLNGTEWDSDWDSDFSLHVKPLSDLSTSSGDESQWEPGNQTKPANNENADRTRKRSDKTVTNAARRNESKPGTTEQRKGPENERPLEGGARRTIGGEDHPKDRQVKRPTVKPIPKIGSDSDSDEAHFRPRPRAFRGDDELSESDMNFFKQQFQATNTRREHEKDTSHESPVGCKGMNCYRCSSFIPECEGVCSLCGTLCQRPGGPCKACRDICERCGKPRYRCTSPDERLGTSDEERGENEEHFDTEADETGPGTPEQRTSPFRGHVNSPVSASAEELTRERSLIGEEVNNSDKSYRKSKERKIRAPPERKSKDPNSVKRVRKKRYRTVDEEDNGQLEEKEVVEEEEHGDDHPQSTEPTQVNSGEVVPVQLQPSAFAAKGTKKTKPSKKVISQTIVYKETKRPPMSIQGHSPGREDINEEDSVVTSPTPLVETVEPGEDLLVQNYDEGTGEEVQMEEKTVEVDSSNDDATEDGKDVGSKGEEEPPANNEEREAEKEKGEEKEEEKQKEKEKRNVLPKIRGVSRVNAAFKERAELGKRLQNVLKEAVSEVMGQADIRTRKDSTIDYIAQYRLVDRSRLEMYGRAFTLEDEDEDGMISYEQMMLALEGVPSIAGLSRKQLMFVLQVLELFPGSRITFKMFSVATALCEKVTILDAFVKQLVEELDLFELECKLDMFRSMFFVTGDFSVTFITADQLRIELKAGGLNQNQEDHVIGHILQSSNTGEISFLDYMAYLPLFLSIHQNICDNALDMSRNKYQRKSTT